MREWTALKERQAPLQLRQRWWQRVPVRGREREGEERSLLVTSHQSLLYPLPFPMKETRAVTVIVITGKVSEMCAEDVDSGKDGRPYPTGCGHHTAWPVRVCHT